MEQNGGSWHGEKMREAQRIAGSGAMGDPGVGATEGREVWGCAQSPYHGGYNVGHKDASGRRGYGGSWYKGK